MGARRHGQQVWSSLVLLRKDGENAGLDLVVDDGLRLDPPVAAVLEPSSHLPHGCDWIVGQLQTPDGTQMSIRRRNPAKPAVEYLSADVTMRKRAT